MVEFASAERDRLVIYHVGGEGHYGPIAAVLRQFPRECLLVIFEAREDSSDSSTATSYTSNGIEMLVVYSGVDQKKGRKKFHINKFVESSSLYPPSELTIADNPNYTHCRTWGDNTELDRAFFVELDALTNLARQHNLPQPDIISIDAQGAELPILKGAGSLLETCLAVVSEVEFFEIYRSQDLFDKQMRLLLKKGFRLAEIFSTQYWHPGPAAGDGFITVGEALFLRYFVEKNQTPIKNGQFSEFAKSSLDDLLKTAAIAFCFRRFSYCYTLLEIIYQRDKTEFERMSNESRFKVVFRLFAKMREHEKDYINDHRFFMKNQIRVARPKVS